MGAVDLRCAYCGAVGESMHLDHVVPRSRGGPDTPNNLVTACPACNLSKRDRLPSEWLDVVPANIEEIERRVSRALGNKVAARRSRKSPVSPDLFTGLVVNPLDLPPRLSGVPGCYFCGARINGADGCILLAHEELGPPFYLKSRPGAHGLIGSMMRPQTYEQLCEWWGRYPDMSLGIVARLAHFGCGDDGAYWIPFDEMSRDWETHIGRKTWGGWVAWHQVFDFVRRHLGVKRVAA